MATFESMSRGFVKEEDQEEPPFIPPRAALPAGVDNYVTEHGYQLLLKEKEELLAARKATKGLNETERRRENTVIDGKIALLEERIHSANVVTYDDEPNEVRFGCTVEFKLLGGKQPARTFQIVGVDEASVKELKVGFVAPIVQAMMGKKAGESFQFSLGGNAQEFEILDVR